MSDTSMGIYDSDTGESLHATHISDLGHDASGEPLALAYTTAKRGRIVQVRAGSLRCHYFMDESTMQEDADRIGRWLEMSGENALRIIRERAPN